MLVEPERYTAYTVRGGIVVVCNDGRILLRPRNSRGYTLWGRVKPGVPLQSPQVRATAERIAGIVSSR